MVPVIWSRLSALPLIRPRPARVRATVAFMSESPGEREAKRAEELHKRLQEVQAGVPRPRSLRNRRLDVRFRPASAQHRRSAAPPVCNSIGLKHLRVLLKPMKMRYRLASGTPRCIDALRRSVEKTRGSTGRRPRRISYARPTGAAALHVWRSSREPRCVCVVLRSASLSLYASGCARRVGGVGK